MKEYDITITETLEKTVSVTAPSREAAEERVREGYFRAEYVLDADDFLGVDFRTEGGREITRQENLLDVLLVKPGEHPQRVQIGSELEDLQAAVGGYIQEVYIGDESAGILCNEEGKLNGLPLNRALRDEDGQLYDVIAGDFLVVGLGEEDFTSLTPEQMEAYDQKFHQPEAFVKMGRSFVVLPIDDETMKRSAAEKTQDAPKKGAHAQGAI